ncbi:phenylalanine 4-monooxygenase, partial [Thioclava sp. BHET1]
MQQIDRTDYRSKLPDAQGRYSYSADEDAVWAALLARQMSTLTNRAVPEFLQGAIKLGLKPARVPQVADIDARLHALSGAGAEGVPAIIAPDRFYDLLSQRRFPVATFLRRREEMDY